MWLNELETNGDGGGTPPPDTHTHQEDGMKGMKMKAPKMAAPKKTPMMMDERAMQREIAKHGKVMGGKHRPER